MSYTVTIPTGWRSNFQPIEPSQNGDRRWRDKDGNIRLRLSTDDPYPWGRPYSLQIGTLKSKNDTGKYINGFEFRLRPPCGQQEAVIERLTLKAAIPWHKNLADFVAFIPAGPAFWIRYSIVEVE